VTGYGNWICSLKSGNFDPGLADKGKEEVGAKEIQPCGSKQPTADQIRPASRVKTGDAQSQRFPSCSLFFSRLTLARGMWRNYCPFRAAACRGYIFRPLIEVTRERTATTDFPPHFAHVLVDGGHLHGVH
jgi:hypothetical protein